MDAMKRKPALTHAEVSARSLCVLALSLKTTPSLPALKDLEKDLRMPPTRSLHRLLHALLRTEEGVSGVGVVRQVGACSLFRMDRLPRGLSRTYLACHLGSIFRVSALTIIAI